MEIPWSYIFCRTSKFPNLDYIRSKYRVLKNKPLLFSWIIFVKCLQNLQVHIQGVSHWSVSFKMAPTDRNMHVTFCLKVSVYSLGLEIWVSLISFQKNYIGKPQQPPTEKVLYNSKNLNFWWSIPHKRFGIGLFDAIDDQSIRIRTFFEEIGL